MERRIDSVREAGSIAHGLDDAELQFNVADSLNDLYTANGEYQRALAEIERGLGLLDRLTNPSAQAGAYFEAAMGILQLDGDARRSRAYGERSRALAKDRSAHEQMHATSVLIEAAYRLGEWDDAIRYLDEHLASFAAESEARCVNVQSGPSLGALVVAHRGDRQRALELAALGRPFEQVLGPVEGAKAGALVAAGHLGEGLALANRVLREAPRFRTVHAAEAAIHAYELTGDAEAMREVTGRVEQLGQGYAFLRPIVERGAGLAAVADGDREAGLARMRGALERLEELGDRFEAARTRELLADLVSAAEARPLLDEALATYRQLGATPHISRLEERIAHL
jgi:tetratricopeptide (TPR) repeat protein